MGRESAFRLLGKMKGTAAVWIDGSGKVWPLFNDAGKAKWEDPKSFWDRVLGR